MKKAILIISLIVGLMVSIAPATPTATTNMTGHWWCLQDGVPIVETPYTDPGQTGYRNAVIWCRLNTGSADAGFLE